LFLQLLTVLAEKPPPSAGYRGSDLVHWVGSGHSLKAPEWRECAKQETLAPAFILNVERWISISHYRAYRDDATV
jgi:hypothetical protein